MKQSPLFRRQFFIQKPGPGVPNSEVGAAVEYIRLQGHSQNPGAILQGQKIVLAAGGMIDVVADSRDGAGVGRISYTPGLRAALKRGEDFLTYRFEVPNNCSEGSSYQVSCYGTDAVAPFQFSIEVGRR
ncbi:MAG: hypothetical protein U0228_18010 [Myxococcaceae bacterium]